MRKIVIIALAFTIALSCKPSVPQQDIETSTSEVPSDIRNLQMRKNIKFNGNLSKSINLKDVKDSITWIYVDGLNECFSINEDQGNLSIDSKYKLLGAKLIINFLPTIWSDMEDNVLQYIQFPSFMSVGITDVPIDSGQTVLLLYKNLSSLPENVRSYMSGITKEDLLASLEANEFEIEVPEAEKRTWKKYISEYKPGMFLEEDNGKFDVNPGSFVLQLTLKGKKGIHVVNLCDKIIIGN